MIRDALFIIGMLFAIGIALLVVNMAFESIATAIDDAPGMPAIATETIDEQSTRFSTVWDFTFLVIFFAVVAGSLILSYYLATEPAIFFIMWIVVGILTILGGYLANAYDTVIQDGLLGASAAEFPIMSFIIGNLLFFMVPVLFLMLIVFFAKPRPGAV